MGLEGANVTTAGNTVVMKQHQLHELLVDCTDVFRIAPEFSLTSVHCEYSSLLRLLTGQYLAFAMFKVLVWFYSRRIDAGHCSGAQCCLRRKLARQTVKPENLVSESSGL